MRVLGFYTRRYRGDTAIVDWHGHVVALSRNRLETAVGAELRSDGKLWIEKGDGLPSHYNFVQPGAAVTVPADVLDEAVRGSLR